MPFLACRFMKSLVARLTGGTNDASIRIQPSQDYVILRGDKGVAGGQYLQGTVMLRLPTPQKVRGVRLSMMGHLRVTPHDPALPAIGTSRTTTIFEHQWDPFDIKALSDPDRHGWIPAGNYEWPFEILIPGNAPETTKGCSRCSIAYYLKASTIREKSGSHPQAFRGIRVIRTLPMSDFELMDAATVENECSEKMSYSASIAHRAVALGTSIPVELDLTLLGTGWRPRSVVCCLVEIHRLEHQDVPGYNIFSGSREVSSWDLLELASLKDDIHQHDSDGHIHIAEDLPLPVDACHCSPDVDAQGIQVAHALHFDMTVQDELGAVEKRRATIPITLFVSPSMPINGTGSFVRTRSPSPVATCTGVPVPPAYGYHFGDDVLDAQS